MYLTLGKLLIGYLILENKIEYKIHEIDFMFANTESILYTF